MLAGFFVPQKFIGKARTKEECVAPPVLGILCAWYPALAGWAKLWRAYGAWGRFHGFLSQPLPFDFAQGRRVG